MAARDLSGAPGRDAVKRWESGKIIPGRFWIAHIAEVLGISHDVLVEEARIARMNRRSFLGLATITAAHGVLASDMVASIAASDANALAQAQTSHAEDLATAMVADRPAIKRMRSWMDSGDTAILRVNSAGILAKLPVDDYAAGVVRTLEHDHEVRNLYITAVTARVCAIDWDTASKIALDPRAHAGDARYIASRLASEVVNPRDVGARWCSAHILRELSPVLGVQQ
jgi:hypothetical protein